MIINNTIYTVWSIGRNSNLEEGKTHHWGTGVNEQCVMTSDGDYIGIETGIFYSKETHYHSELFNAQIIAVDEINKTGMYHLDYDLPRVLKKKYIGAIVTVREAHWAGKHKIYYCQELGEYFSDNEIKLL